MVVRTLRCLKGLLSVTVTQNFKVLELDFLIFGLQTFGSLNKRAIFRFSAYLSVKFRIWLARVTVRDISRHLMELALYLCRWTSLGASSHRYWLLWFLLSFSMILITHKHIIGLSDLCQLIRLILLVSNNFLSQFAPVARVLSNVILA